MSPSHPAPIVLAAALLVGGCAGEAADPTAPTPTPTEEPTMAESSVDPSTGLDAQVELAVSRLAAHLDVPAEEIEVASAQAVTWGDASLGCPQPGMRYAQVVTEGVQIVLAHDGVEYAFHAGEGRPDPFLCEQQAEQGPSPTITPP